MRVGRAGTLRLQAGFYVYVGSALGPGGLRGRLAHHIATAASPRWHIDYLRRRLPLHAIWFSVGRERREHLWARAMGGAIPLAGFGASDCGCAAHLFFFPAAPSRRAFRARLRRADPAHPPVRVGPRGWLAAGAAGSRPRT